MMSMKNFNKIMEEYYPDNSIWCEDDERMKKIKHSILKLSDADRIIFILYCEKGSLREVGKILNVSHTTIFKVIKEIKNKILNDIDYYDLESIDD